MGIARLGDPERAAPELPERLTKSRAAVVSLGRSRVGLAKRHDLDRRVAHFLQESVEGRALQQDLKS